MRLFLRVCGFTVVELALESSESVRDEGPQFAGGGQSGCLERDLSPLSPDDRYDWEVEDRQSFGFH